VPFSGMDDEDTGSTRGREDICAWSDSGLETRDVVAERGAKPAGLQKIPLHIDNDERGPASVDGNCRRLRFYGLHWHDSLRLSGRAPRG
jgi:hypothetical protein